MAELGPITRAETEKEAVALGPGQAAMVWEAGRAVTASGMPPGMGHQAEYTSGLRQTAGEGRGGVAGGLWGWGEAGEIEVDERGGEQGNEGQEGGGGSGVWGQGRQ